MTSKYWPVGLRRGSTLRTLFDSWHEVLSQYELTLGPKLVPWGFSEMSNVGLLGAAASRIEGWHWIVEKIVLRRPKPGGRKVVQGRLDLFVQTQAGTKYAFEAAKLPWRLTNSENVRDAVWQTISSKTGPVSELASVLPDSWEWDRGYAIVFLDVFLDNNDDFIEDPGYDARVAAIRDQLGRPGKFGCDWSVVRYSNAPHKDLRNWRVRPMVAVVGKRVGRPA